MDNNKTNNDGQIVENNNLGLFSPEVVVNDDNNNDNNEDDNNHLYDLLEADDMTSATSLHSNLRDSTPLGTFGASGNNEEEQWRSTATILSDAQQLDATEVYQDVYRSVAAMDLSSQHQMGLEGGKFVDTTREEILAGGGNPTSSILAPAPRVFDRIRLEHTHIYVSCPLKRFVEEMNIQFKVLNVDFMFEPAGCFWRGMYFPQEPNQAVDFRVFLNSCPNNFLVEFVRRSGCGMAFNNIFTQIRQSLIDQKIVANADGTLITTVLDIPPTYNASDLLKQADQQLSSSSQDADLLPRPLLSRSSSTNSSVDSDFDDSDDLADIECSDQELFQPLYDMSKSAFQDVHVQGLALIAREAKRGNVTRLLNACPGTIDLLTERLVGSTHPEVRRHCCTTLCEIARDQSLHTAMLEKGAPAILAEIAATAYNPATLETQRQAATALSNLCTNADSLKAVFQAVESKIALFEELAKCDDSRLTKAITSVRSALEAC